MDFPKNGMHYEDVRTRVKRISKENTTEEGKRLIHSLLGQAERHERGAGKEIAKEFLGGK